MIKYTEYKNNDNQKLIIIAVAVICLIVCGSIYLSNKGNKKGSINGGINNSTNNGTSNVVNNETMMQYFEMYLPNDGTLWKKVSSEAANLSASGITSLWLPPAYKGDGSKDAGYSAYDLYDLGEFNQKGTVRTKYGTKDEYLAAINSLHNSNIKAYADIVLDHKSGADTTEKVTATKVNGSNRNNISGSSTQITSWTIYNFPGRNGQYSNFKWDATCFDGVDWDHATSSSAVYLFQGKSWDQGVSTENGNYDYLMGSDIDFESEKVVTELKSWGEWYVNFANLDGFRLDAIKHITNSFYPDWLSTVRNSTGKDLFSVGEYWSGNVKELQSYIEATNSSTNLFDVPLHYNLNKASTGNGNFDLTKLFTNTLVQTNPELAVTFVDNHDTQTGQSLASEVTAWFKPMAYCTILTRKEGIPCIYYSDYYGSSNGKIPSYKDKLDVLLKVRKDYAYGEQTDYLNDKDLIGWTRKGDSLHSNSGLAALISDGTGGSITMNVGANHASETWYDITGNQSNKVVIDSSGSGVFTVGEKSYSVWVPDGTNSVSVQVDVDDSSTNTNTNTNSNTNNSSNINNNTNANNSNSSVTSTVKPVTTTSPSNAVTVYYYSTLSSYNIHYQIGTGEWTSVPGKAMSKSNYSGYFVYTIDLGSASTFTCCFNNNDNWDNNGNKNYQLKPGTYTIKNKVVTQGVPK